MDALTQAPLEIAVLAAAAAAAAWFRPWSTLRQVSLRSPWLAALALLPWLWGLQRWVPGGLDLQLSGACLLVLAFGWPLAVLTLMPIAALGGWIAGASALHTLTAAAWNGIVPATLALAIGIAMRRWLPRHLFVYILGRGFLATAIAVAAAGSLQAVWQPLPSGVEIATLLTGRWLIAWSEAFMTGMLTAIFVAFRPEWLFTYSDRRYLPR